MERYFLKKHVAKIIDNLKSVFSILQKSLNIGL